MTAIEALCYEARGFDTHDTWVALEHGLACDIIRQTSCDDPIHRLSVHVRSTVLGHLYLPHASYQDSYNLWVEFNVKGLYILPPSHSFLSHFRLGLDWAWRNGRWSLLFEELGPYGPFTSYTSNKRKGEKMLCSWNCGVRCMYKAIRLCAMPHFASRLCRLAWSVYLYISRSCYCSVR